ncbi:Protein sensitivity to red light reduced 1 [Vitis vinifera]|uniref:Protein sensitivity to red light reduced 1 n=1 Tax=Vitis vinifera TaxID=29760 RepID=A0A438G8W9_VITVI|nr:Protein sensitivity to red light reduced 1 [Vitis vinifera]
MAASAKTITLDSSNIISDWTVVLPCCADFEMDHHRETKLMQKIQICIEKLENSTFYHVLLDQVQTPHMLEAFFRLSLAILLKRKFSWIGDIEVLDPILSVTELECWKPWVVLFYQLMSKVGDKLQSLHRSSCHTVRQSYTIILYRQNGRTERLNNIVLFGNNFGTYEQHVSEFRSSTLVDSSRHILAV